MAGDPKTPSKIDSLPGRIQEDGADANDLFDEAGLLKHQRPK